MPEPAPPVAVDRRHTRRAGGLLTWLAPIVVGLVSLALWQGAVWYYDLPHYVLPGPKRIADVFADETARQILLDAWKVTLKTAGLAIVAAATGGVALALLLTSSRIAELSLFPYAVVLQVTPLVAVAPLIVMWVGMERTELIWLVCAWIVAFFPVLSNTVVGLRSVDGGLRDLFDLYRATRWQRWRLLLAPSALPYFLAGLKISANLALVGAVVAEFVTGAAVERPGLASVILESQYRLDVPRMFAALVLISCTGIALFYGTHWLGHLFLRRWHASHLSDSR
jgi:NitT/TauT family transport system permease protein